MRVVKFKYHLLDKADNFKKELYCIEKCTVTYNSLSRLKSSATMYMREDKAIDYYNDRIKVICNIDGVDTAIGVFLISGPNRVLGARITRDVTLYSKLKILDDDKVTERYYLPKGTNVVNEVKRLLGSYMVTIADSSKTTSTDKEYEIGTAKLDIINDLLGIINYTSIRVDRNGYYTATPYVLPTDRTVDFIYQPEPNSILCMGMEESLDLFDVANVFVRYTNNPDISPPLRVVYENNNASSPTSIINRGRRIVDAQAVEDVADTQTLTDVCKRAAYNATDKYSSIEFRTAINPSHDYMNCLQVKQYDINDKYIETEWTIECKVGEKMKHRARKVVAI